MTGKHGGKKGKGLKFGTILTLGIIAVLVGSYAIYGGITGNWLLWWEPAAEEPAAVNVVTFKVVDRWTVDELDAANISVYGANVTDLTTAEINALNGSTDFSLLGYNATGEGFTLDENFRYVGIATCAGYNDQEFKITAGIFVVSLLPVATNASILGISGTLKTNLKNNSVANTTETDWTLLVQCLNSSGSANNSLGFTPFCNFIGGSAVYEDFATFTNQFLIDMNFNVTADVDWITVSGMDVTVVNSTTHLYILVDAEVIGGETLGVIFDGIGVDFVVKSAYTGFGGVAGYTLLGVLA
jgi:hypothetical protein